MNINTKPPRRFANYVNGKDQDGRQRETFESTNPTTGAAFGSFVESSPADVDAAVQAARAAFDGPWRKLSPTRRGRLLMRWGDLIADNAEKIATIETEQNGKLIGEMRLQARVVQDWLYYFGGLADKIEGRVVPLDRTSVLNYTVNEPLGVVAAIVPWNSPTFLTIMTVAPALAAGNTVVIKPSEVTSASAIELARLAEQAGIPEGVINVVTGGRAAGEALVDHPLVAKVSFTGSDSAGRAIAARAGQRLVSCMLELGGKSANIVFDDADLDQVEAGVLAGIFAAAGQTCVAGSRAYFQKGIYDRLVGRLIERAGKIRVGDPLKADTQMGPVATAAQLAKDESMVARAVEDGAKILAGGQRRRVEGLDGGFFYAPTILGNTKPDAFIMQNEVFGPVLCVTPFETEEEVLALANGTRFGLAAGLWTADLRRAHLMARGLQAGTVWINTYRAMAFNSPFGGFKNSGIGRLNGAEAIQSFLQTKSVWCELSRDVQDPFVLKA
ncbi:MAG: aldehyde dehydrogenase [Bradyrhizobium sp.]|uniref:aldehyde dehydrogenase n=1 Tax=Bradyrhizobium sp. TaxID=376 RepID=UPI00120A7FDF|nr:aldehyde dehydrogenase [Bradyrhizobium sp.]THD67276.1 MAG: aldehyde dehydrogenase [Bradyrhizobium sp.]